MKRAELFRPTVVQHEGSTLRAFKLSCGHCSAEARTAVNTMKGTSDEREQEIIAQKFRKLGWKVGQSPGAHRCPSCFAAARNARRQQTGEGKVVELRLENKEAKREMQREEKRLIFAKIHEVYLDEKRGYAENWSDGKIAADLGIPRDWVKQVREELFGPEGSSEHLRAVVAEATQFLEQARRLAPQADDIVSKCRALLMAAERVEKALVAIERSLA